MVVNTLDATFAALADPTRRAILFHLGKAPATVGMLAAPFKITQQAISKHIAVLKRAKLLRQEKDGRLHRCILDPAPLDEATAWIEEHRILWNDRFDRLDTLLRISNGK
ncbi:MAG: metalloregulator ArsR/SmtB family transcription factor [Planctomycetota bacterium]|nr:metalloregulator ArsR/SmtB family transcription factor [Planctomycetota bacterium]